MTEKELELYKMTESEKQNWNIIRQTIFVYCQKLQIPEFMYERIEMLTSGGMKYGHHVAGYCENAGYFYIEYGDRGTLYLKCLSYNSEDICFYIMKQITRETGQKIELQERNEEAQKWMYYLDDKKTRPGKLVWIKNENYIYHTKHDTRKKWFEYMLNALLEIFEKEMIAPMIEECTWYMNRWFEEPHWSYDMKLRAFVETPVIPSERKIYDD